MGYSAVSTLFFFIFEESADYYLDYLINYSKLQKCQKKKNSFKVSKSPCWHVSIAHLIQTKVLKQTKFYIIWAVAKYFFALKIPKQLNLVLLFVSVPLQPVLLVFTRPNHQMQGALSVLLIATHSETGRLSVTATLDSSALTATLPPWPAPVREHTYT